MNRNVISVFSHLNKDQSGYTLVEAIIAIAVCGFGLAIILGLYGMVIKTEMVSRTIYEQSLEINSIADEINLSLHDASSESLADRVALILGNNYPDYQLADIKQETQPNLYNLTIIHQDSKKAGKQFFIKIFWRHDETPDA